MAQQLEDILEELGISQYLDAFVDQGFDTWETILDITESDLDALGVKLGHRRKLQRKIANFRGIAPDAALASPTRAPADEATRPESHKYDATGNGVDGRSIPGASGKRKYRRHPKPDESAPERPPSAYVLFSNKMREKLKGQNLSFTEIAKLVGEKWQTLTPAERKPYDSEAQAAKDKYNQAMALYKKTPEYQRYILYLQEFKARHSNQTQDRDAFKRIKLADFGTASHPSSVNSASPPASLHRARQRHRSDATCGSISSTDGLPDSDTPQPSLRRDHAGSSVSAYDSHYSSASPTPGPHEALVDGGSAHSPRSNGHSDWSPRPTSMSPREAMVSASSSTPSLLNRSGQSSQVRPKPRAQSTGQLAGVPGDLSSGNGVNLPSLSDVFENRRLHTAGSGSPIPAPPGLTGGVSSGSCGGGGGGGGGGAGGAGAGGGAVTGAAATGTAGTTCDFRSSMLRHEQSSSGTSTSTMSSSSASSGYPRTPMDGSLPIHSLLSSKPPSPSPSPSLSVSGHFRRPSTSAPSQTGLGSMPSPQMMTGSPGHKHKYSPPPPRPYLPGPDAHVSGGGQFSSLRNLI